jgi:GntR family transcriptional regulator/MocR family aminotransferase
MRSGIFISAELALRSLSDAPKSRAAQSRISAFDQEAVLCGPVPFRPSQPDVRLFPLATWNRLRSRAMKSLGTGLLHYQSRFALGLPSLRHALAAYLFESRGVRCEWTQIAITGGSQQALYLLGQLLLKRGDTVLLEDPGYRGARFAFEHAGARIRTMPVDDHGAVAPKPPKSTRIIYSTPSRQYPTGACLQVARRLAMLDAAQASKAWLLEDDYDSEFRYTRAPLPSLHSLDSKGRVIYLGSMSKVLFPSLRIGYIVLPRELVQPFESLRLIVDDHGPLIDQATLAEFIVSGEFYTHIRRCRKEYAVRLTTFLETAESSHLPLAFPFTDGGMNQTGFFVDPQVNGELASQQLAVHGLDIPSTERFSIGKTRQGLVFGFTAFDQKMIQTQVAKVARVLLASVNRDAPPS